MSRLARYGDYEYDEEREKMYKASDETRVTWPDQRGQSRPDDRATRNEPWMLRQVEEYFIRLTSTIHRFPSSPTKLRLSYQDKIGQYARRSETENEPRVETGDNIFLTIWLKNLKTLNGPSQ